jgi:hypothetical protein
MQRLLVRAQLLEVTQRIGLQVIFSYGSSLEDIAAYQLPLPSI